MKQFATLRGKQRLALIALLEGATVNSAAAAAGVDRSTLWRWMQSPAFSSALVEGANMAIVTTARRLAGASEGAVSVLVDLYENEEAPASTRARAADLVLSHMTRLADLTNIMARLDALEAKYHAR